MVRYRVWRVMHEVEGFGALGVDLEFYASAKQGRAGQSRYGSPRIVCDVTISLVLAKR